MMRVPTPYCLRDYLSDCMSKNAVHGIYDLQEVNKDSSQTGFVQIVIRNLAYNMFAWKI